MKKLLICCALLLMAFMPASTVNDYRYILIQSHQVKPATMQFFDQNGKLLSTKSIDLQGIGRNSGEIGLTTPVHYNGNILIGSFGQNVKQQLLSLNLATLQTKFLSVKPRNLGNYSTFTIFNNEMYSALNAPIGDNIFAAFLGKHSLTSADNRIERSLKHAYIDTFIPYRNELLSIGFDWRKKGIVLRTHNSDTLDVIRERRISTLDGINDVKLIGHELFISALRNGKESNNQLLVYHLQTNKARTIQLPFSYPEFLVVNQNTIFVTQDRRENGYWMPIAKVNRQTGDLEKSITLRANIKHIQFAHNELIVITENRVLFYNPTTMKVKRSFPYKTKDDMMFGSFIVR